MAIHDLVYEAISMCEVNVRKDLVCTSVLVCTQTEIAFVDCEPHSSSHRRKFNVPPASRLVSQANLAASYLPLQR